MTGLLELKERLIRFFGKNEIYVVPVATGMPAACMPSGTGGTCFYL